MQHEKPKTSRWTNAHLIAGLTLLAAILIAGASWFIFFRTEPYEIKGGNYSPPNQAASLGSAVDQHGQPFSLEDHEGELTFVFFGYTHCPDYCPATLADFVDIKDKLGDDAEHVNFVMVTVDPERDTPERLAEYIEFFDPTFYGLSMPPEETQQVARDWFVQYSYEDANSQGGYMVNHSVSSYVVDKEGNLRLTYPDGFDTSDIASDLRYLINEE